MIRNLYVFIESLPFQGERNLKNLNSSLPQLRNPFSDILDSHLDLVWTIPWKSSPYFEEDFELRFVFLPILPLNSSF